nr:hypothetical protein [Nocardia abscessus]
MEQRQPAVGTPETYWNLLSSRPPRRTAGAVSEESVDQLTALVGDLLDSSRLAVGVVTPRLRRVYLDEAVHHRGKLVGRRELLREVWGPSHATRDALPTDLLGQQRADGPSAMSEEP